jgi:ferric-dicitrate binding protein FerR (iron transport regulator)
MNDSERIELNELCSALVDGRLSAGENRRLQEMLRGSAEARQFYVRAMQLSASLHSYASEMQSEPAEPANIIRPSFWQRSVRIVTAAAAVVAIGIWIGRSLIPDAVSIDEEEEFIAHISGSKEPVWTQVGAFQNGDELQRGQRIELKSGFTEVTFDSGAQIVIEGPASVDLDSAWQATLRHGTVKANIPQEAIGFRISNPAVDVVDLGTEFSVTAEENGAAEVFVLSGQVEVEPRTNSNEPPRKMLMKEKQSRRFAINGVSEVRDSEQKFIKLAKHVTFDLPKRTATYIHWPLDSINNTATLGEILGAKAKHGPLALSFREPFELTDGKFGKAAAFTSSMGAEMPVAKTGKRMVRTVAFWIKLPEDASAADGSAFARFSGLELGWNSRPADGSPGALRITNGRGRAVASTPLRDSRWHHVAAVVSLPPPNSTKPASKSQARLYVDGRLESWTGKHGGKKGQQGSLIPADIISFGATGDERGFRGVMDEIFVSERALSPIEIRALMRTNSPHIPENLAVNY